MAWQRDRSDNRRRGGNRFDDFGGGGGYEPRAPRDSGFGAPRSSSGGGGMGNVVTQPNVTATVKWFNPTKGFGFVSPSDGSADAFLHISALERAGHQAVAEGATIVCDMGQGQRGPQVVNVLSVDESTAAPSAPRREAPQPTGEIVEGTVKFFSADKGFGFIALDDGGKDVFVHIRALERSGLRALEPNQRVRMSISMGQKGPQADSIALI